jgi:hypothetical protein
VVKPCDAARSNESQARCGRSVAGRKRRDVIPCATEQSDSIYRRIKRRRRNPSGHNCFLPILRINSHLSLPSYTLRAANYSKRHHHARPHHTSRDAILLTHSHPRAASGHTHCHLPTRYPHLVLLLPLGVAALQSHRVQLTEHYVTFTKPQHPDFWRAPL